jgi:hypothetical protein
MFGLFGLKNEVVHRLLVFILVCGMKCVAITISFLIGIYHLI